MTVPALIEFQGGALIADLLADASTTRAIELTQHAIEDGSQITDHAIRQPLTLELTLVQTETPIAEEPGFALVSQELDFPVRGVEPRTTSLDFRVRGVERQNATLQVRKQEFRPVSLSGLAEGILDALFGNTIAIDGLKADGAEGTAQLIGVRSENVPASVPGSSTLAINVLAAGAPKDRINEFDNVLVKLMLTAQPTIVTIKGQALPNMIITSVTRTDAAGEVGCARFKVALQSFATVFTKTVDLPPVPAATVTKSKGGKDTKTPPPKVREKTALLSGLQSIGVLSDPEPLESEEP